MTEMIARDRLKFAGRAMLFPVVTLFLLLFLAHFLGPILRASAQETTPTSSETTSSTQTPNPSPSPEPTGRTIQFLNPSNYSNPRIVSIKPDVDGFYHLVAWVSRPQADDLVEFEALPADQNGNPTGAPGVTIGTAVAAFNPPGGPPDTFECFWSLGPDVPNGNYVLRAKLFEDLGPAPATTSCGTGTPPASPSPTASPASPAPSATPRPGAVATDDEPVTVDRNAETVEITYPDNGDPLGIYDPDDPEPASTSDTDGARRDGFTVDVRTSEGAEGVVLWYSVSNRGNEPEWTRCREQVTTRYSDGSRRIGCTFPGNPPTVNAVAVQARDDTPGTPPPSPSCLVQTTLTSQCDSPAPSPTPSQSFESGDAHRVSGSYNANPASVALTHLDGDNTQNRLACHEMLMTVLDERGRPVWRANVDVHGTGPGDGLRFAETERTHPFGPPDQGAHSGTEPAWNCTENESHDERMQAEHDRPGETGGQPIPDRKHIESVASTSANEPAEQSGTDMEGEFVFALRSPSAGTTTVEAWADEDDDDENDVDEAGPNPRDPQDTDQVNWLQATPTPPPTATPSGTPTATPTGTPTATPTGTPTATPTASPSGSGAPQGDTLNCDPESDQNPVRSPHSVLCRVSRTAGSPSPTSSSLAGTRVHGEATGANDPDNANSPGEPDFTCVTESDGTCSFTHGPGGAGSTNDTGTTLYRVWIDTGNNASSEADPSEGRDEFQQPGQTPEADGTDVVEKTWARAPLDCDPEQDANPTGSAHTVTCRAATAAGEARSGTQIDVEATGANDPDSSDTPNDPDFTCTTDQNGSCSFVHGPGGTGTTNLEGITRYRAWIDADTSNAIAEADRTEGRNETQEPGTMAEADETDVVDKTWIRNPTALSITPESDTASVGSCNAFTITVTGDGQAVAGVLVDVEQRHERSDNQTNNDEPRVRTRRPSTRPRATSTRPTRARTTPGRSAARRSHRPTRRGR